MERISLREQTLFSRKYLASVLAFRTLQLRILLGAKSTPLLLRILDFYSTILVMGTHQASNDPAPAVSYFTPLQCPSPGTALELNENTPTIFRPLEIRGIKLRNRICVSPMCMYSCAPSGPQTGVLTPLYYTLIGNYAYRGVALIMMEATGVQPNSRISVNCAGLWNDTQAAALKGIVDFVHSQGGLIGVQLSHAGRKASTTAPWVAAEMGMYSAKAGKEQGGWPENVVGPMGGDDQTWDGKRADDPTGGFHAPRQMTKEDIVTLRLDWAKAAERAVGAGIDTIEIHAAHGYLLHEFLSPITNQRTDQYGGSFENRIRLLVEVIEAVREVVPSTMPVVVRISASDWMEDHELGRKLGSWDVDSTVALAKMLPDLGVDVLDTSSGANHPGAAWNVFNAGLKQAEAAMKIRHEVKAAGKQLLIGTVGQVTNAEQARDMLQDGSNDAKSDLIFVGRQLLREPEWVLNVAEELGVDVAWPKQIARAQLPRAKV